MPGPSDSFVHLHNHTEYSMLDGAAKIDDLFSEAARMGMPAVATTDHGFVFGAYEFWKKAKKHGVKPIIGVEAYVTPGTNRKDRTRVRWGDGGGDDVSGTGAYTHMTLWSENNTGMHNLFRLASLASMEGMFYKPRMDREILSKYHEGLIATTGCPSGEVQTRLRLGQYKEAVAAAAEWRDVFGEGNYYCEVMDHGLGIERRIQQDLVKLARELNLPLVATNDLHYTKPEDAKAHACCCACSPAPPWPTPSASSSTPTSSTSSRRRRCASCGRSCRTPATTPWRSPSAATSPSPSRSAR